MTESENPFDLDSLEEIEPIVVSDFVVTSSDRKELAPPDLEGCTDDSHCHRRRSPRRESAWTERGTIKGCHEPKGFRTSHPGYGPCRFHGGNTPASVVSAEREQAQAAATEFGLRKDIGPAEAILEEIQYTAGHVEFFRRELQRLQKAQLTWGIYRETIEPAPEDDEPSGGKSSSEFRASPHVLYQLYEKERKHLTNVCDVALKAGVAERLVRMYEQAGDAYVNLIENVLNRLNLTDEQRRSVPAAVASELRAMIGEPEQSPVGSRHEGSGGRA